VAHDLLVDVHAQPGAFEDRDLAAIELAVGLLARNYVAGDHALIEQALRASREENERHWLGYGALAVFEANLSADATVALTALYETGPCAACRER
jgi:hypothetical protein